MVLRCPYLITSCVVLLVHKLVQGGLVQARATAAAALRRGGLQVSPVLLGALFGAICELFSLLFSQSVPRL